VYIYLRISYRVYMCVFVHLRICTQTSHVSLYILPYKYAESTYVTYTHTESTCGCICLRRIHVQVYMCVYVVAYMDTEFTCVCVNIYVYVRRVHVRVYTFQYIHTESKCVCVYSYVYTHRVYMCVGVYLCTCILSFQVYLYIFTFRYTEIVWVCVCLYS